jgi:flagellar basal-body rod modification protein FlgD
MADPISALRLAATTSPTDPARPGPDALGKDAFLKLLVAQLKYQNPMSPLDGSEFLAQTAQFTMLEKLEEISRQGAQHTVATMLGRQVSYPGKNGQRAVGVVTGTRLEPTGPVLLVGEDEVPLQAVQQIDLAS